MLPNAENEDIFYDACSRGSTHRKPRILFLETQRILENPQGFRQNPAESRESPWFRLHKVIKNPQESFGIPWNPQESPWIPSESPESSRILRILRIFPPINLGNLIQNFWSIAPLVVRKLFSSTRGTIDKRAHRKRLGLTLAFCRNHFCKLFTNVRSCWVVIQ